MTMFSSSIHLPANVKSKSLNLSEPPKHSTRGSLRRAYLHGWKFPDMNWIPGQALLGSRNLNILLLHTFEKVIDAWIPSLLPWIIILVSGIWLF
jgi:hypothetical protein